MGRRIRSRAARWIGRAAVAAQAAPSASGSAVERIDPDALGEW